MSIRITQLLQKNRRKKIAFLFLCFSLLSLYPIYSNFYEGKGLWQYERHIAVMENRSEFYNPWQYRILSPLIAEGGFRLYMATIDKVIKLEDYIKIKLPVEDNAQKGETLKFLEQAQNPDFLKYMLVFVAFRFLENMLIFYLAYLFYAYFVKNDWLIFFSLIFISLSMGNSVNDSDLSFNTYLDNIVYLLMGIIIVYRKNPWWLVPIAILGSFNRETSIMVPYLFFLSYMGFSAVNLRQPGTLKQIKWPPMQIWVVSAVATVFFLSIFVGIRMYFEYIPAQQWKVPPGPAMLKLNLLSFLAIKSYFEMVGTLGVFPFIALYKFRKCDYQLRLFFIAMVPIWFFVHWWSVVAYQSRLYLVPTLLVFLPMTLQVIEQSFKRQATEEISEASAA